MVVGVEGKRFAGGGAGALPELVTSYYVRTLYLAPWLQCRLDQVGRPSCLRFLLWPGRAGLGCVTSALIMSRVVQHCSPTLPLPARGGEELVSDLVLSPHQFSNSTAVAGDHQGSVTPNKDISPLLIVIEVSPSILACCGCLLSAPV